MAGCVPRTRQTGPQCSIVTSSTAHEAPRLRGLDLARAVVQPLPGPAHTQIEAEVGDRLPAILQVDGGGFGRGAEGLLWKDVIEIGLLEIDCPIFDIEPVPVEVVAVTTGSPRPRARPAVDCGSIGS